jgi:hypothetical protein
MKQVGEHQLRTGSPALQPILLHEVMIFDSRSILLHSGQTWRESVLLGRAAHEQASARSVTEPSMVKFASADSV